MADERFVWVDWSATERDPTRITVYERRGWALRVVTSRAIRAPNADAVARATADLCLQYNCPPRVEAFGPGNAILDILQRHLPRDFARTEPKKEG